ncbi:MAG: GTPase HflX [Alphaproteobacteria bacterium]|nr:GTPase HflX [Alphaproteobacteria bacterium]
MLKPLLKTDRSASARAPEAMLAEAAGLAEAISLKVAAAEAFNLSHPAPATLLGRGQVENWKSVIADEAIQLVVVDHPLTPVQQRNLERAWNCKVIDRTGLILEIFGERARTREGQLQVELAALSYQKSRLVRSWTHLERQRGGFGFLGGPGESQLEIDRRLITNRIARLKEELRQVRRTRGLQREARQRAEHPTIALVGYTNAGKSTLFNRLTGADVLVEDMLFATLDPSMRGLTLPSGRKVILSDTVGFISDLPTHLVEAFRATLEEVQLADVILHVRDATHAEARTQKEAVEAVLADLGIEADDPRLIDVLNKADLLPEDERHRMQAHADRTSREARRALPLEGLKQEARGGTVVVSALTGEGVGNLLRLLDERLASRTQLYDIEVPLSEGAALAWLYKHGKILERKNKKTKAALKVTLDAADFGRFNNKFGKKPRG